MNKLVLAVHISPQVITKTSVRICDLLDGSRQNTPLCAERARLGKLNMFVRLWTGKKNCPRKYLETCEVFHQNNSTKVHIFTFNYTNLFFPVFLLLSENISLESKPAVGFFFRIVSFVTTSE